MIYYLNFGLIIEQAIADLIRTYFKRQNLDSLYKNFHISVVNEHPFAHMIIDNNARCADNFPAVVISSQSDSKTGEFQNLQPQTSYVGYTSTDIDNLFNSVYREKQKINENGEIVSVIKNNEVQKEVIPGVILTKTDEEIEKLKEIADSRSKSEIEGMVYGLKISTRKTDNVSIEIWCENNQLKNELYENIRVFLSGALPLIINEKYGIFCPAIFDKTIRGERSSNYNLDFDTLLCGAHLSFDVDYDISQIIIDTDLIDINRDVITEVINHVKNENSN